MVCSIKALSGAGKAADYYAKDDLYYDRPERAGEAAEGRWTGKLASELGLSGKVAPGDFAAVLEGKVDGVELGRQRAGQREHKTGYDVSFSAPKSVSVLAQVARDERLAEAHRDAVTAALAVVERESIVERVGKGQRETGAMLAARFEHGLSRKHDPDLHTHVVIANATRGEDGKLRSIEGKRLYDDNKLIGAVYHAELRSRVHRLGYETRDHASEKANGAFEIEGPSPALLKALSQRRQEIEAALEQRGRSDARAAGQAAVMTRSGKRSVEAEALEQSWSEAVERSGGMAPLQACVEQARSRAKLAEKDQDRAEAPLSGARIREALAGIAKRVGLDAGASRDRYGQPAPASSELEVEAAGAVSRALRNLEHRAAAFPLREARREALAQGGRDVRLEHVDARLQRLQSQGLVKLGASRVGTPTLTTPGAIEAERAVLKHLEAGKGRGPEIATEPLRAAAARELGLSTEQRAAQETALAGPDRISLIGGPAGAGKTTTLQAVDMAARSGGAKVLVLAPTHNAVQEAGSQAGVQAQTLAAFLHDRPRGRPLADTVLVVDEAGLVPARAMRGLLDRAEKQGAARVVLLGDERQGAPIEAGRPLQILKENGADQAHLTEVRRQKGELLEAAKDLARQPAEAARILDPYIIEAGPRLVDHAIAQWRSAEPDQDGRRPLLIALTNDRVKELTSAAREVMKEEGRLSGPTAPFEVLLPRGLAPGDAERNSSYRLGDVLEFWKDAPGGTSSYAPGERPTYTVTREARPDGRIELTRDDGRRYELSTPRGGEGANLPFQHFRTEQRELQAGDLLRWRYNDRERGLISGQTATVLQVSPDGVGLRLANGLERTLRNDDWMLQRWEHGYGITTARAQGMTVDRSIGVTSQEDGKAAKVEAVYVLATRHRAGFALVVDSKEQFADSLRRNAGRVEPHALEVVRSAKEGSLASVANPSAAVEHGHADREAGRRPEAREAPHQRCERLHEKTFDIASVRAWQKELGVEKSL